MKIQLVKRSLLFLVLLPLLFLSCAKEKQDSDILIRVQNQTGQRLDDVSIFSFSADLGTDSEKSYGSVSAGMNSPYQQHEKVFNIPLFKSRLEGFGIFELRNIECGTGLAELGTGKYSLVIKTDNNDYPYMYFQKD